MAIIEITLKELQEFGLNNGYTFAIYHKEKDGNWHLTKETIDDDVVSLDTTLVANHFKGQTSMKETVTKDKKYLFKLHNNYNLPKIIPCFPEK